MKQLKKKKVNMKRLKALVMAFVVVVSTFGSQMSAALGSTMPVGTVIEHLQNPIAYMGNTLQCIDGFSELGPNGGYEHDEDSYIHVNPSSSVSGQEAGIIFWSLFFFYSGFSSNMDGSFQNMDLTGIRANFEKLKAAGLATEDISADHIHKIIHNTSVLNSHPIIKNLGTNESQATNYLTAMGLIGGGSGTGVGGKTVPSVFNGHTTPTTALDIAETLTVDTGDPEFLTAVKIEFSGDLGATYSTTPVNGWSYTISGSTITFSNPDENVSKTLVRFNTDGTAYASAGGSGFGSPAECYESCLEIWTCQTCCGGKAGKILPSSMHQRFASLNMNGSPSGSPFAGLGKTKDGGSSGLTFTAYKHTEDWTSHYNVQIEKRDYETGKGLEGSSFYLYERFDDKGQINSSADGSVTLYKGGAPYFSAYGDNPVTWDNFMYLAGVTTDANGHAAFTREHKYHYEKTFCDGHPAPEFVEVPEKKEDPKTKKVLNEDEIEEAQQKNMDAAAGWLATLADCESHAFDFAGVHFHWVMPYVDESAISNIASSGGEPGDTPSAGTATSADGDTAYEESGCRADCEATYDKFISLKYSYAWKEIKARPGYTVHGSHTDDIPIEVITTDSSENGANASFAGGYTGEFTLNDGAAPVLMTGVPKKLSVLLADHEVHPSGEKEESTEKKIVSIFEIIKDTIVGAFGRGSIPSDTEKKEENSAETGSEAGSEAEITAEPTVEPEEIHAEDEVVVPAEAVEEGQEPIVTENEPEEISTEEEKAPSIVEIIDGAAEFVSRIGDAFLITAYAASGTGPDSIYDAGYAEADGQEAGSGVSAGPSGNYSHCNDADGEGNAWRIYDHRTEGEIHINKRDLDLSNDKSAAFNDYAEENGDGTLEGAVYGLFAADNIVHPDGHSELIYAVDDLVAMATTDRYGNASFLVNTVAPDSTFDYETGSVVRRNERASIANNLYDHAHEDDDYTIDGKYTRKYPDLRTLNGNEWIGRPLILGSYYVKELSRSEGYELSVGLKDNVISNFGQDINAKAGSGSVSTGMATVTRAPMYDAQLFEDRTGILVSPDPEYPDANEVFFEVTSKLTGTDGYDLKLGMFPTGTKLYREEDSKSTITSQVGTGVYEEVQELDGVGNPIPIVAGDNDCIEYDTFGNPKTYIVYPDTKVTGISVYSQTAIDPAQVTAALTDEEDGMTDTEVELALAADYDASRETFVKAKVEKALRYNGRNTPSESGVFSTVTTPVYDNGDTEADLYGRPVQTIMFSGASLKNQDVILSILDFYDTCGYYGFGGVKSISVSGTGYTVEVYAGMTSKDVTFATEVGGVTAVFAPVKHAGTTDKMQRYVYAVYTPAAMAALSDGTTVFGTYSDYSVTGSKAKATLSPKAAAVDPASYTLSSEELVKTKFYPAGTTPVYGPDGNIRYKTKWVEKTTARTYEVIKPSWKLLATTTEASATVHADSAFTDGLGTLHGDSAGETIRYLAVLPGAKRITLTAADITAMGADNILDYTAGENIPAAEYAVLVNKVYVKTYAGHSTIGTLTGPGSYIKAVELAYPGQTTPMTDAGTINTPVEVYERPIRQSVKVGKDIALDADRDQDGTGDSYRDNTYGVPEVVKETNFRFKAYLKSNLERLYRDKNGTIVWMDVNGNEMTPVITGSTLTWLKGADTYDFPEIDRMDGSSVDSLNVQKIYTKVTHDTTSKTMSLLGNNVINSYLAPSAGFVDVAKLGTYSTALRTTCGEAIRANSSLYSYEGNCTNVAGSPKLRDASNDSFTRILETKDVSVENGAGSMVSVPMYDYDKFFDALAVANGDKWDDHAPTCTSWRPVGNKANRSEYSIDNAKRSDRVRQFAISWYLQDEVAKLVKKVPASVSGGKYTEDEAIRDLSANNYSEAVFDEALNKAIRKAEDYLKPFFKYDLDTIYSLSWDHDALGGTDKDLTTVSTDGDNTKETYNVSAYLPYGDYVIVEQQPQYVGTDAAAYNDFINKHYKTDRPKEVKVPSLYEGDVSDDTTDNYATKYTYDYAKSNEYWASSDYLIRFAEEWNQNGSGTPGHVIRAHSFYGDFEIYPYGLDVDNLSGSVSSGPYTGCSIVQTEDSPSKSYYAPGHYGESVGGSRVPLAEKDGANDGCTWNMESLNAGKEPTANGTAHYDAADLRKRTAYASVSEDAGKATIISKDKTITDPENMSGMKLRTDVSAITGELIAYNGEYAQMLVPYTVARPSSLTSYTGAAFLGYADVNVRNRLYTAKLRIEKLDSETHENILHDDAVFAIYKAQRDETTGDVKFYTVDTPITGSKEFVTAYCDRTTVMPVDPEDPAGEYRGTVKAGTPICAETDLVILGDRYGSRVSEFRAFSTAQDLPAKTESGNVSTDPATFVTQNVGYIETPQPLGAGAYVLVEKKAPSGYVRTAPVAVEIYSDKTTYYKEGKKDERILAAVYDEPSTNDLTVNKNKPQDRVDVAEVYVEDDPIKLAVEKVKESSVSSADTTADKTVTYRYSGRITGTTTDFTGREDVVLAFNSAGKYQGYAWKKGTLEYLASLKKKYDADGDPLTKVEIVYNGSVFTGYGFVTVPLLTADDDNRYAANALLTLYDAVQLRRNPAFNFGESDYAFSFPDGGVPHGLIVKRDPGTNRVTRIYVEKGYAGVKTEFRKETDASGNERTADYVTGYDRKGKPIVTTGNIWNAVTVEREDTDILFYDLSGIELTFTRDLGNGDTLYGYDKNHKLVDVQRLVNDGFGYDETDTDISIYAYKGQQAVFELTGGDLTLAKFNEAEKCLDVDAGTVCYHLDADGNRDALVDPHTGMAFVIEKCDDGHGGTCDKYLVWPVETYKDSYGYVVARDKITTSRVATIGENVAADEDAFTEIPRAADPNGDAAAGTAVTYKHDETGSVTGSWTSGVTGGAESHTQTTDRTTKYDHKNLNGQTLVTDNNGAVVKQYSPVYDSCGNILYYQRSNDTYDKGTDLYDRDEDFVRYDASDGLAEYSSNAYRQNTVAELYDTDGKTESPATKELYHRYGEGYVLQNTWRSSDETPNDPFRSVQTDGQADLLKRVPAGTYIMEELTAPAGYAKAFPAGITVKETTDVQSVKMVDHTLKVEVAKIDGQQKFKVDVFDMDKGGIKTGTAREGAAIYSYGLVPGAKLVLYKADRVSTTDYARYPKGYYLVKAEATPFKYKTSNWKASTPAGDILECVWVTTADEPIWLEGLPEGDYLLYEEETPEGFVTADPVEIEVRSDLAVQEILVNDDHNKVEIEKFYIDSHTSAKKALSGAKFELHRAKLDGSGNVEYDADGNPKYEAAALTAWKTADDKVWPGFAEKFRDAYRTNGTATVTISWTDGHGVAHTAAKTACEQLDQTLAGGVSTAYPTNALMTFKDELGREIRVKVYEQKMASGTVDYTMDFAFDVRKDPLLGAFAVSYTTAAGVRRFDYIPEGKYVAVETVAPTGYVPALPKLITVSGTADIQHYGVEDRESQIVISKVLEGHTKETKGATLTLYRAEAGALVKDAAHLVETWQSGTDGTYTEEDLLRGRVVSGYSVGDLRPHSIRKLPAGTYYLLEEKSPGYYSRIAPLRIEYADPSIIKFVRAVNVPVVGKLTIEKKDENCDPLSGAIFLLQRYDKDGYLTPAWENTYVMASGTLTVSGLPVGEVLADGSVLPYRYRVSEILPPSGYRVDNKAVSFSFRADNLGVSYAFGEAAEFTHTVTEQKTSFRLSKKLLTSLGTDESDDAFVDGAKLEVYDLIGTDLNGAPIYDSSAPLRTYTLSKATHEYDLTGLTAGKTYVVAETLLPDGLELMEPHMFAISADGRKIEALGSKMNSLTFNSIKPEDYRPGTENVDTDSIMSVKMSGRYAVSVNYEVTDSAGTVIETFPGGYDHDIELAAGYTDGGSYTVTEKVTYSDGSTAVTDAVSKLFCFGDTGKFTFRTRTVEKVSLALCYEDGDLIDELDVTAEEFEKLIINPVSLENPLFTMTQTGKDAGDPIERSYAIENTLTVINPDHRASDAVVKVRHGTGISVISAGAGVVSGDTITFTVPDVPAYGTKTFRYFTRADGCEARADITLQIAGRTIVAERVVPCVLPNNLTVFYDVEGSGRKAFADEAAEVQIRLYNNADGKELAGTYHYGGSHTGTMRSGDSFTLRANEYIRIDTGICHDVAYNVTRFADGRPFAEKGMTGNFTNVLGAAAVIRQTFRDTGERVIFTKGGTYDLCEITQLSDGGKRFTNRMRFTLGDAASVEKIGLFDGENKTAVEKVTPEGMPLSGCVLEIYDAENNLVDSWTTEGSKHILEGTLMAGHPYRLHEKTAKEGYLLSPDIIFTAGENGAVKRVVMVDRKEPDPEPPVDPEPPTPPDPPAPPDPPVPPTPQPPGPEPEEPGFVPAEEEPKTVGRITATYAKTMYGTGGGYYDHTGKWHPFLWPFGRFGDEFPWEVLMAVFFGSLLLLIFILLKNKKNRVTMLTALVLMLLFSAVAFAAPVTEYRAGGTYISPPFVGDGKDCYPAPIREIDGIRMEKISCEMIDIETEERTEEQTVPYEYYGLEEGTAVPDVQEIEFTDENTGNVFTEKLPLISAETTDRYWDNGFSFPIHVEHVDADTFLLGDKEVPGEAPLLNYAEDLLEMLGLDPDHYRITAIEWSGDPYEDAEGVICRDALATGQKFLRDVTAVYGGLVTYPAVSAKAWECEYREIVPQRPEEMTPAEPETENSELPTPVEEPGPDGLRGIIRAIYEAVKQAVGKVVRIIKEHPQESVLCLVVSAAFIIFLLLTGAKQKCLFQSKVQCPYRKRTTETCNTCLYRYQQPQPKKGLFRPKNRVKQ
ncbi:MAG: SpaA isopeptide-forming pilin-related protein [Eubacteriales bacterium]|nr:SpaA isopeptide-forming pilin-related protein [Eubacteriales bacterium]